MKHSRVVSVLAVAVCFLLSAPPFIFADGPSEFEQTPTGSYTATVPFIPDEGSSTPNTAPLDIIPPVNPIMEAWQNPSPLSIGEMGFREVIFKRPEAMTEEEAAQMLQSLSGMIDLFIKTSTDEAAIKQYADANDLIKAFLLQSTSNGMDLLGSSEAGFSIGNSDETDEKDRWTALNTWRKVNEILNSALPMTQTRYPALSPSGDLIQRFAHFVVSNVQIAKERVEDGSLRKARKFSLTDLDVQDVPTNGSVADQPGHDGVLYAVVESLVLTSQDAKTHASLNPSRNLHPFLGWLFYKPNLTPERVARYLKARAKIKEIFLRAKAGEGLIRYKGTVMETFLPLPGDESGGTFELVRRM